MWKICIFSVFLKHENVKCLNAFLNRMIHNDSDLDIICLFLDLDETLKVQKKMTEQVIFHYNFVHLNKKNASCSYKKPTKILLESGILLYFVLWANV